MHLSPPPPPPVALADGGGSVVVDSLLIVTPIVGFYNCFMFCCALLCVNSSFAIISTGNRAPVALLCSFPDVSCLLCGSSSRCHGFVFSL